MKCISYIFLLLGALLTLTLGLYPLSRSLGGSLSAGGFGFLVWTMSPYSFMAWLIGASDHKTATAGLFGLCFVVGLLGLALIFYVTVVYPDPQGAIPYFFTPLLQWVILLVVGLPLRSYLGGNKPSR